MEYRNEEDEMGEVKQRGAKSASDSESDHIDPFLKRIANVPATMYTLGSSMTAFVLPLSSLMLRENVAPLRYFGNKAGPRAVPLRRLGVPAGSVQLSTSVEARGAGASGPPGMTAAEARATN